MSTLQPSRGHARFRLAGNDNETVVIDDELDVEGHRLAGNDNETVVDDAEGDAADPAPRR